MWEYQFDKLCGLWKTAVAWVIWNFCSFCCGGVKKRRTEASSDGFIVRPKENWALVELWRRNVEEIWMKIVPFYLKCPRIESSPSCREATSIHVTKPLAYMLLRNKINRNCVQNILMFYYVCGACFYFCLSNCSSVDHTTSAFHQTMAYSLNPH